jgi:drug/metabolite transporter (DMT)-like permease
MIKIVILYALFASTFSLGKVLLNFAPPIFLVGIRMTIAGFLLLAYQYFHKNTVFKFKKKHWKLYLQGILFTCYFPYILRFWGLRYMASSKASLIYTLGPFITYVLSYFMVNEKVTSKKIIGLLIGFVGLLPILIVPSPTEDIRGGIGAFSWPEISIILSISCLSYGWLVMHKLIREKDYSPAMVNGISMFVGGLMAFVTSLIFEPMAHITDPTTFLSLLGIIILVSNLICHNIYGYLLKKYSPTFLSFASFLTPLFAAFYGWLFLSEKISWAFIISSGCVILGLAIFYQGELHQQKIEEKVKKANPEDEEMSAIL